MKKLRTILFFVTTLTVLAGITKEFYIEVIDKDGVSHFDFSGPPYDYIVTKAWIDARPYELFTNSLEIEYLWIDNYLSLIYFDIGDFPTSWSTGDNLYVYLKQETTNVDNPFPNYMTLDTGDQNVVFDGPSLGGGPGISIYIPSSVEAQNIPMQTELYQNYPNPFNPETKISFDLHEDSDVTLSIFNYDGQLVKELVSGKFSAGNHSVNFNAADLNSGVYFYILETGETKFTKKMLLIK